MRLGLTLLLLAATGPRAIAGEPCTLSTKSWLGDVSLSASADGPPFAKLASWQKGPRATLAVGAVLGVAISGDGLELRAVAAPGPWLFPRRPLRIGRVVIAASGAHLTLRDPAQLIVALDEIDGFKPAQPLQATVDCDALSLDLVKLRDARKATGFPATKRRLLLRGGVDVPIAAEPAGEIQGTLSFTDELAPEVEVVKQASGWSQIVIDQYSTLIYGWVPSGFVHKPEPAGDMLGGVMGGLGGFGLSGRGLGGPPPRSCTGPLAVSLRQRKRVAPGEIGSVQPGTRFFTRATDERWTAIELESLPWLQLLPGNELVVATSELQRCEASSLDR
jgi:hypothetical protein